MGKKCVVNGCLQTAGFQWEYGGSLTYTCKIHCIKDLGCAVERKALVHVGKRSEGSGLNCKSFIGICVFVYFFVVFFNFFVNQHFFISGFARKVDDLRSISTVSYKFKAEFAEIKSLINQLKPVKVKKNKKSFNTSREKDKEVVVLTKDEAISALVDTKLTFYTRKKILSDSLGIAYDIDKSEILSITFANDGQEVVYGTMSGLIYQGNLLSKNLTLLKKVDSRVYNILPTLDQTKFLVSGSTKLRILSLNTKELIDLSLSHSHWIISAVYSPDNTLIVTGSCDRLVKVWNSSNYNLFYDLKRHTGDVWSIVVNEENSVLFTAGEKGEVFSWDLASKTMKKSFTGHIGAVYSILLTKNQENLITGSADGTIRIWSTEDNSQIAVLNHPGLVRKLILLNQDQTLLSISGKTLNIWNLTEPKLLKTLSHPSNLISLALSPDQKFLAAGDDSNRIWIWDLNTNTLLLVLGGNQEEIISIKVSTDSTLIAVFEKGLIRIWDTNTMKLIEVITKKSEVSKWNEFLSNEKVLDSLE